MRVERGEMIVDTGRRAVREGSRKVPRIDGTMNEDVMGGYVLETRVWLFTYVKDVSG